MQPMELVPLGPRFSSALAYAAELHGDQARKGTAIPYVAHLLAVAALVIEYGGDEDQAIAALLHDAVEDQGGPDTLKRIRARFGKRVADLVDACTDSYEQGPNKPRWKERKEKYLASLPGKSREALLISAADKLHNATSILEDYVEHGEDLWPRFKGGRESLWYYGELVKQLRERTDPRLYRRLEATVKELHRLAREEYLQ
jgi:(p)ppGpp synthase/HD superfamily hydrolase